VALIILAQNTRGYLCWVRTWEGVVLGMKAQCEDEMQFGDKHYCDLPTIFCELLTPLWWQQNVKTLCPDLFIFFTHFGSICFCQSLAVDIIINFRLFWKFFKERGSL
jgi:hypothetical protein